MKKSIYLLIGCLLISSILMAQAPNLFNYQGVAHSSSGPLINQAIGLKISILENFANGTVLFSESHTVSTNNYGLYSLAIGGGTSLSGNMRTIDWSSGNKYIKVEIDPAGGTTYVDLGSTQLLSVPYALYAASAEGLFKTFSSTILYTDTANFGKDFLANTNQINHNSGNEYKMLFLPSKKGAFRAGDITSTNWDMDSIGNTSFAVGRNTKAYGIYSTAMGHSTEASGIYSTAMGNWTKASGHSSIAIGERTKASNMNSTAMGYSTEASGYSSTAMGHNSKALASYSTVIGKYITLSSNATGSMYLAYASRTTATDVDSRLTSNCFFARFKNGYYLYTDFIGDIGVRLTGNGNSWSTISDSTKKENYLDVDGKEFLNKIGQMKLGSWNYKEQDKSKFRHYGPLAQEFYAHFGNDGIGTIGNDTTIATADIDGVMMIAIQALIKENEDLQTELSALKISQEKRQELEALNKQEQVNALEKMNQLENLVQQLIEQNELKNKQEQIAEKLFEKTKNYEAKAQ